MLLVRDIVRALDDELSKATNVNQVKTLVTDWITSSIGLCNIVIYFDSDNDGTLKHMFALKYTHYFGGYLRSRFEERFIDSLLQFDKTPIQNWRSGRTRFRVMGSKLLYQNRVVGGIFLFNLRTRSSFGGKETALLHAVSLRIISTMARIRLAEQQGKQKPKKNPQDWWKRGEPPPY